MPPQNNVTHKLVVLYGTVEDRGGRFNRGLDFDEASTKKGLRCTLCILKKPRLTEAREERNKFRSRGQFARTFTDSEHIRSASALGFQPSSGNQRPAQVRKQLIVVEHPMKRRRAHYPVEARLERQAQQITKN